MTVHAGRGWRLAPSLIALEAEANRLAPRRSQASDGSIGDSAHRHRKSDHNPSGGIVHAIDLTADPRGGFDAHAHGRAIAARRDPRVAYLISNRQIWEPATGWRRYDGENPHTKHLHVSIAHSRSAENDTSTWLPWAGAGTAPVPPGTPSTQPTPIPTPTPDDLTERPMQIIHCPDAPAAAHVDPNTWWATDGNTARPLAPGEPDHIVLMGLVPRPVRDAAGGLRPYPLPWSFFQRLRR